MKKLFFSLILIITAFSNATLKAQQTKPADQIVAIVNDRIILKSEIDNDLRNYIMQSRNYGQQIEFSKDLWYQFLDGAVENYVLLEKAVIDSIYVEDEQVNRSMDQRIQQLIQQAGSE